MEGKIMGRTFRKIARRSKISAYIKRLNQQTEEIQPMGEGSWTQVIQTNGGISHPVSPLFMDNLSAYPDLIKKSYNQVNKQMTKEKRGIK
jgi:hypothetical protein